MADQIKYVSYDGLKHYDGKIKTYITDADAALKSSLEGQVEVVAGALDEEITRAKAAELANATAAENAQTDVDNLEKLVGALPSGVTATTVVGYIDEKTANIASDATVNALAERVTQAESDIDGLESNKADKTQVATDIATAVKVETDARVEAVQGVQNAVDTLEQTVANNKTAIEGTVSTLEEKVDANETDIEGKMTALTERVAANETAVGTTLPNSIAEVKTTADAAKASIDAFLKEADATETAIDTLKEIQAELNEGEANAASMLASIQQNGKDIDAVEGRLDVVEPKVTTLEGEMDDAQAAIEALQTAVGDGGSVDGKIDDAVSAAIESEVERVDAELDKKVDKVEGKGLSTNDLTNELKAQYDAAYAHSQVAHAPADAQKNIIESVKVNGVALTVTDKAVDVTVPTDNAELTNGAGYLVAADIANKADKATTLAGYGIADAYTTVQTDTAIANAIGQLEEVTDEEINALFA